MIKFMKRVLCKIHWHSFSYDYLEHDGASVHAQCKWCKYKGMVDSQGNLF